MTILCDTLLTFLSLLVRAHLLFSAWMSLDYKSSNLITSLVILFEMASHQEPDWDALLKAKYSSFKVEVQAYLDSLDISTSTKISIEKIYHAIRNDEKVNSNLKLLYREACFGSNKDVKTRIKNRISNFRRSLWLVSIFWCSVIESTFNLLLCRYLIFVDHFRGHPQVKRIDMLHAADYANMGIAQMNHKVESAKKTEKSIAEAIVSLYK